MKHQAAKQAAPVSASTLPRSFRLIRLELAREAGHPAGSAASGYTILAPLDGEGRIDAEAWQDYRQACRVTRFRPYQETEIGHLIRKGNGWAFHYDVRGEDDDEAGFRFSDEHFVIGEYVSIRAEEGLHTFRVVSVERP